VLFQSASLNYRVSPSPQDARSIRCGRSSDGSQMKMNCPGRRRILSRRPNC